MGAFRQKVVEEFAKSGMAEDEVTFRCFVRMQYYGQLSDLEIYSPAQRLEAATDVDRLIEAFEDAYGKMYALSAKSPELGYLVTYVIVYGHRRGREAVAPGRAAGRPPAARGEGDAGGLVAAEWVEAADLGDVRPEGRKPDRRARDRRESRPPRSWCRPGRRARLDEHRIFHLETEEGLTT